MAFHYRYGKNRIGKNAIRGKFNALLEEDERFQILTSEELINIILIEFHMFK